MKDGNPESSPAQPAPAGTVIAGDAKRHDGQRYRIRMLKSAAGRWSLVATDTCSRRAVLRWEGIRIGRLLEAHPSLWAATERRDLYCSKAFIRKLAMQKAALDLALEQGASRRRRGADVAAAGPGTRGHQALIRHHRDEEIVASLLRSREGIHYTLNEALCLLNLNGYALTESRVGQILDRLSDRGELQKITVPCGRVFYDCDTTPHLHFYDARKNELRDAPATGVLSGPVLV